MESAFITTDDRRRLGSLLDADDLGLDPTAKSQLEELLEEAVYVEREETPTSVVTMNTTVQLLDVGSQESEIITLAYPEAAEFIDDSVSVTEPLGMALLGSSVGEVVQYSNGRGTAKLKIRRIIHQPENSPAGPPA